MSMATASLSSKERLDVLFSEMEELAGQRRARTEYGRDRCRRQPAQPGITGPATDSTPAFGETVPRPVGGTCRMVVVHTDRTATTTLGRL